MKKLGALVLSFSAFLFLQCNEEESPSCSTYATIRDLSGLDGCGFVLELEDGSQLEPLLLIRCGTPESNERITTHGFEDFELAAGKRVKISYEETGNMSICMAGPVVKITCIQEVLMHNPEKD